MELSREGRRKEDGLDEGKVEEGSRQSHTPWTLSRYANHIEIQYTQSHQRVIKIY